MTDLPPEDQPDTIQIGPVGPIPIFHDDDPRLEKERSEWSRARRCAHAMHTPEQLLAGLVDDDWRVRHEVVDRLAVRGKEDDRIVPALVVALQDDPAWEVRDAVAMRLHEFDADRVIDALRRALNDPHPEVRWSASYLWGAITRSWP